MPNFEAVGKTGAQKKCCAMMKSMKSESSLDLRMNGLPLTDFPVASKEAFAAYVKNLMKNPKYKILGQKPGPDQEQQTLRTAQQVDTVLDAGGEINICDAIRPLVG